MIDLYILNTNFETVAVIDTFASLIWTRRYFEPGDFELYVEATPNLMQYVQRDYYVTRDNDETVMIIERIELQTDIENGNYLLISGRSLESLLSRRIVWPQTIIYDATPISVAMTLVENNIGANADEVIHNRIVPNFTVDSSTETSLEIRPAYSFTGDNLMEAVTTLAKRFGFGWKVTLSDGQFVFSCYLRDKVDVIFSPEFDNFINSNYVCDSINYKTKAIWAGEGEGSSRVYGIAHRIGDRAVSPVYERELYVDARDLVYEGETTDEYGKYINTLIERSRADLAEYVLSKTFEGQIEPNVTWQYKKDYDVGNIVSVENEYGISATPRIIEVIESYDLEGYKVILTFEEWEV